MGFIIIIVSHAVWMKLVALNSIFSGGRGPPMAMMKLSRVGPLLLAIWKYLSQKSFTAQVSSSPFGTLTIPNS